MVSVFRSLEQGTIEAYSGFSNPFEFSSRPPMTRISKYFGIIRQFKYNVNRDMFMLLGVQYNMINHVDKRHRH